MIRIPVVTLQSHLSPVRDPAGTATNIQFKSLSIGAKKSFPSALDFFLDYT